MGLNRKLADLAQFIDSSSSGESITKSATGVGTKAVLSSDVQGSAGTFTFTDSSYIANIISASYITSKTGKAATLTGTKAMFQGSMPDLVPQASATYDLGDSAKPLAELILDSSASLFFGTGSLTSKLLGGSALDVGGGGGSSGPTWYGDRGIIWGGYVGGSLNNRIEYFDITTTGDTADFGDLTTTRRGSPAAVSDGSRCLIAGGVDTDSIEYITSSTTGNATAFGNFGTSSSVHYGPSDHSDGTYGYFVLNQSAIEYVTIQTAANSTEFGSAHGQGRYLAGTNDDTRAIHTNGTSETTNVNINYFEMGTYSTAADFGDLTQARTPTGAASDGTYGIFMGGNGTNNIDYVTIQTTGNATDFGDLVNANSKMSAVSHNATRAVRNGGVNSSYSGEVNVLEYITMATTGNATDFGDMLGTKSQHAATSGSPS